MQAAHSSSGQYGIDVDHDVRERRESNALAAAESRLLGVADGEWTGVDFDDAVHEVYDPVFGDPTFGVEGAFDRRSLRSELRATSTISQAFVGCSAS